MLSIFQTSNYLETLKKGSIAASYFSIKSVGVKCCWVVIVMFSFFPFSLWAQEFGIGGAVGFNSNMTAYRFSLQKTAYYCPIRGYWQGSLNYVQGRGDGCNGFNGQNRCNGNIFGGSIAHVLSFSKRCSDIFLLPYGELGLGLAFFNRDHICERNLGLKTLFEVILGVGFRFGPVEEYDIGYKFIHYSNAYLGRHNDGLNFNFISFNYWFY